VNLVATPPPRATCLPAMALSCFVAAALLVASPARADVTAAEATQQIAEIAAWDVTMQLTACPEPDGGDDAGADASCALGGVREIATGPVMISPDNTAEAIFDWSYAQQLSGDSSYLQNVAGAFGFLDANPQWEQGSAYPGSYICGWVLRAVVEYEAVSGDVSHHAFGQTCALEIETSAPGLATSGQLIDVGSAAWGASGLWIWGDANADAEAESDAASIGGAVKAWIEQGPATNLPMQSWAFTGGAAFHGVVGSYMKANPSELQAWVTTYAPMLGGWIDESTPAVPGGTTDWRNAYNAWNMAAHYAAAHALGAEAGATDESIARDILGRLVAQEMPGTGAIPGSQQRPSTETQSWITAYMLYFGLQEVVDEGMADGGSPVRAGGGGCSCTVVQDGSSRGTSVATLAAGLLVALLLAARRGRAPSTSGVDGRPRRFRRAGALRAS
jgi:MYXO-CTERM domain-containing protein